MTFIRTCLLSLIVLGLASASSSATDLYDPRRPDVSSYTSRDLSTRADLDARRREVLRRDDFLRRDAGVGRGAYVPPERVVRVPQTPRERFLADRGGRSVYDAYQPRTVYRPHVSSRPGVTFRSGGVTHIGRPVVFYDTRFDGRFGHGGYHHGRGLHPHLHPRLRPTYGPVYHRPVYVTPYCPSGVVYRQRPGVTIRF